MKRLLLVVIMFWAYPTIGQQYASFSNFQENNIRFNPAMIHYGYYHDGPNHGSDPFLVFGVVGREQWTRLKPYNVDNVKSASIFGSAYFKNARIATGGYLHTDQLGPISTYAYYGQFSYDLIPKKSDKLYNTNLMIGLSTGFFHTNVDISKIYFHGPVTINLDDFRRQGTFEAIPGLYFSQQIGADSKKNFTFYTSIAAPRILRLNNNTAANNSQLDPAWHLNVSFGLFIPLAHERFILEPFIRAKDAIATASLYTVGARVYFRVGNDFSRTSVWIGTQGSSYKNVYTRGGFGANFSTGIKFSTSDDSGIRLGLSYDGTPAIYSASNLGGTMEFHISFFNEGFERRR